MSGQARREGVKLLIGMIGKKESRFLNPILDLLDRVESKAIKIVAVYKDKLSFMDGQKRIIKDHSIQYSKLHTICKEQKKELKNKAANEKILNKELNKTTEQRDKYKNRLLKKWNRLKSQMIEKNKKRIKKYVDKKKIQILKWEKKVQK